MQCAIRSLHEFAVYMALQNIFKNKISFKAIHLQMSKKLLMEVAGRTFFSKLFGNDKSIFQIEKK